MGATCRSCHAAVVWVVTTAGASMPLDPEPRADGNIEMTGRTRRTKQGGMAPEVSYVPTQGALIASDEPRYVSHFATCPNAEQHRRPAHRGEPA